MRIAYLDCASGISGDMTLGALVDAGADLAAIQAGIDSLGLPSCRLVRHGSQKEGLSRHANHGRARAGAQTSPLAPHHGDDRRQHAHAAAEGTGHANLSADWPRPRPRCTARRSKRCIFTKSGPSTRSPISSAPQSASTARRRANRLLAGADRSRIRRNCARPLFDSRAGDRRVAARCAAGGDATSRAS